MKRLSVLVGLVFGTSAMATAREDAADRQIMHKYAKCVVHSHHKAASDAILANADNVEITRRYFALIDPECLGKVAEGINMQFGGELYRYALADALVNADFAHTDISDFSDRLPLAHVAMPDRAIYDKMTAQTKSEAKRKDIEKVYHVASSTAWLSRYGECIARADPEDARLWILTPPDMPEEASRIDKLRPAFGGCLDGGSLTFGRVTLRGTVALNYYRLAMAPPVEAARKLN